MVRTYAYRVLRHTISLIIHVSNAQVIAKLAQTHPFVWNVQKDSTQTTQQRTRVCNVNQTA